MTTEQAFVCGGRLCRRGRQVRNPSCIRETNPLSSKRMQPLNAISTGALSRTFKDLSLLRPLRLTTTERSGEGSLGPSQPYLVTSFARISPV
jgi:hypothetical protein